MNIFSVKTQNAEENMTQGRHKYADLNFEGWAWMAEREEQVSFFQLKGKIPKCSEIRVCQWRQGTVFWPSLSHRVRRLWCDSPSRHD